MGNIWKNRCRLSFKFMRLRNLFVKAGPLQPLCEMQLTYFSQRPAPLHAAMAARERNSLCLSDLSSAVKSLSLPQKHRHQFIFMVSFMKYLLGTFSVSTIDQFFLDIM